MSKTKDRNAESFLSSFEEIKRVCKLKAENPKWGERKISSHLEGESKPVPLSSIHRYYKTFLFDLEEECLFHKSMELTEIQHCHTRMVRMVDAECYPVELQWANNPEGRAGQAQYAVGETVWPRSAAANLGGAAGVAGLRPQWH